MEWWEYMSLKLEGADLEQTLTELGVQGWELVSVMPGAWSATAVGNMGTPTAFAVDYYRAILKRRRQ